MGKKDKKGKKGKGAEKTSLKTDKKLLAKQKKLLEKLGEVDIAEVVANLEEEEKRLTAITEFVCQPPSSRSSFTLTSHPEKEELFLFGGEFFNGQKVLIYNDFYIYNIVKNEWKQLRSPSGPAARSGHQMVAVASDGGQLWLYGGEHASPSQMQFYHYKDLWVMRLKTKKWEKINASNGPSARSGHRMVAAKKKLVVFGGFHDNNQSYTYYNDVHMFSLETYTWLNIVVEGVTLPSPRSGCCMAAYPDGKIIIWGGYSKTRVKKDVDRGKVHTDMFALTCKDDKFKWTTVKPGGYKPLPYSSVGFTSAPNGKMYCFGGVMDVDEDEEDVRGQFGDDLLAFDLATQTWRLLQIAKKIKQTNGSSDVDMETSLELEPQPKVASVSTDGIFTITVADPSSKPILPKVPSLFPERVPKSLPSVRMNPIMCVCKGKLYLFGGLYELETKQITLNDFYALDLQKLDEWKVLIPNDMAAHDWIDSESSSDSSDESEDDDQESDDESEMDTDE